MNTIYNGYSTTFNPTRSRLILLCLLLLFTQKLFADNRMHMIPVSLEKRVQAADVVVEGEVISKRSFWDAQRENIYTSNIIKVYKLFKGTLQETQLEVITDGGTVGLDKHVYSVALTLKEGQQGLFFLKQQNRLTNTPGNTRYSARPYASEQGFIRYDVQAQTAQGVFDSYSSVEQVYRAITKNTGTNYRTITTNKKLQAAPQQQSQKQNNVLAAVITGFSPKTASAGTRTVLTITGTGFGNVRGKGFVSFRNADDGGKTFTKSPEDAYLSWTNTQIRMYIPSAGEDGGTAGTGEIKVTPDGGTAFTTTDKITIIYAYSNLYEDSISYQPALIDVDGQGGYTIHFAPNMQSSTNAREGFTRAMNSWICNTNVNWKIGAPTSIDKSAADDQIVITFKPESTVGEDVLARTLSRYRGCQVVATGVINWWMSEFDMEINSNITWEYGPGPPEGRQFDFETVMLHELGHAHQLGHVILPQRAVMHYALEFARAFRDLSPEDIEGGKVVIASSTQENVATACRKPVMKPKLDGVCNLAEEVATLQADFNSEHDVVVTWEAATEENIVRYVIERSEDGINFTDIGSVDAAAENSFTDQDPLRGTGYYRLRVIYKDGSFKLTFVARVTDPSFLFKFEVAPNPVGADQKFTVRFLVNKNTPMQLYLYDTSGKIVRNFETTFTDMNLPLEFDMTGISAGVYILKWSSGQSSGTTKIVKL